MLPSEIDCPRCGSLFQTSYLLCALPVLTRCPVCGGHWVSGKGGPTVEVPFEDSLVEIDDEGLVLTLLHGSRWRVEGRDIKTASLWAPRCVIRVSHAGSSALPYELTNLDTEEYVLAASA